MPSRRIQTRQQAKEITYCDSIHTLVMSPRSSAHNPNEDGSLKVPGSTSYHIRQQREDSGPKGAFAFVRRALAACSRKPSQPPSLTQPHQAPKRASASAVNRKLSGAETAAVRQLLSPLPKNNNNKGYTSSSSSSSLDSSSASLTISSPTSLSPSPSFNAPSFRSRTSASSYQPFVPSSRVRNTNSTGAHYARPIRT
ncbi:hypothetical protein FRB97_008425 [Tulasnella sp. 331]|nr:hypothetical protein FRB97_008425 [Tulasnella sp. 331]KAG8888245.1 hypothetical protein FRB98_008079 [Tulasnella sp. 332]